jgi:hypothetical protein
MSFLADYSGPLDLDFSYEKLDRDALLKLLNGCADHVRRLDAYWYLSVMNKCGNETAFECDTEVWEKLASSLMDWVSEVLNIKSGDVVALMKALQANPWAPMYKTEMEVINNDHGIVTFTDCPTLDALEKEGKGREKLICCDLEVKLMEVKARYFNPDIVVTPLKMPPREPGSGICCQWELKLERGK